MQTKDFEISFFHHHKRAIAHMVLVFVPVRNRTRTYQYVLVLAPRNVRNVPGIRYVRTCPKYHF